MTAKKAITTDKAPAALGPYSQAVQTGNSLYISGQLGINPAAGKIVNGGITAQARQALLNVEAILTAGGFSKEEVVQVQIFLTDMPAFRAVNDIYTQFFSEPFPARAVTEVSALPAGGLIEITAIAVK